MIRTQLRAQTLQLHDKVESLWTDDGAFAERATYLAWLGCLLTAHRRLGLPAAVARGSFEDIQRERESIARLCEDLQMRRLPQGANSLASISYAWGVGYVLNGSALGASLLLKRDSLAPNWPQRYLEMAAAHARSGGVYAYFKALEHASVVLDEAIAGAKDTFSLFRSI